METWPVTLPQVLLSDGYGEKANPYVVRTDMEVGPTKARRRVSSGVTDIQGRLVLTTAQVVILDNFYLNTVNCVDSFSWVHQRTKAASVYRFVEAPEYTHLEGKWNVSLSLEILY